MGSELLEAYRKMFWAFVPTSRKKKEKFLELVRDKVAYYQSRIEEKCKINLGEIKVKDNSKWLSDTAYADARKRAVESAFEQGRMPTNLDFHLSFVVSSTAEAILVIPLWLCNSFRGVDFRQFNNTLYVPFYYMNRFMDIDFEERAERVDLEVVHEISHSLWEKISGDKNGGFGERRKWFEGFATYCMVDFFANLYPQGTKKIRIVPRLYADGRNKIEKVIEKYGEGAILEIPNKWVEFSKEF